MITSAATTLPERANLPKPRSLLTAKQVRLRYGDIGEMTLWRWLRDPELRFPQPTVINRIRYWPERELDAFDERLAQARAR